MLMILNAAAAWAAPDVLVVCPGEFRAALAPWEAHRRGQGHELAIIEPPPSSTELHTAIRDAAASGALKFVVLIGDVPDARAGGEPTVAAASDERPRASQRAAGNAVPTRYAEARINVRWGSEPAIASDALYADVDRDALPDVAIGRIPADTADELAAVVRKILRYEREADDSEWRRKIDVVAGRGGFGPLADTLIEATARRVFEQTVPADYVVRRQNATAAAVQQQMADGCLAWVYLGHGLPYELDLLGATKRPEPILKTADVPMLGCGANSPLAVLVACYTGAFDAPRDCLAEELALHEGGPVAVIAATRVTMPYGNTVFGCELLRAGFMSRAATVGELWTTAQRRTLADAMPLDSLRLSVDVLARRVSPPPIDLAAERREHVLMYHLFGDPLLRLQYPVAATPETTRLSAATEVGTQK